MAKTNIKYKLFVIVPELFAGQDPTGVLIVIVVDEVTAVDVGWIVEVLDCIMELVEVDITVNPGLLELVFVEAMLDTVVRGLSTMLALLILKPMLTCDVIELSTAKS